MNRRTALQQLAILTSGAAFLPACSFDSEKVSIALDHLKIKASHEKLLAGVVDTLIPKTETSGVATSGASTPGASTPGASTPGASTPGASTLGAQELDVHHFVLVMVDDCQDKSNQEAFVKGLDQFEPYVKKQYDKKFLKNNQQERETILADIMKPEADAPSQPEKVSKEKPEFDLSAIRAFLSLTKQYTVNGYMVSQYIMTDVFPYKLVPGPFEGCVPVSQLQIM